MKGLKIAAIAVGIAVGVYLAILFMSEWGIPGVWYDGLRKKRIVDTWK